MLKIALQLVFILSAIYGSSVPLLQEENGKFWCPITGENLQLHSDTNFLARLQNGRIRQYSSYYGVYSDEKNYGLQKNSIYYFDIERDRFVPYKTKVHYSEKDFQKETLWNSNIKVKKQYKMGEKIYKQKCKSTQIDLDMFLEINELKYFLLDENLCGQLDEKYLHSLSIYLWDIHKLGLTQNKNIVVVHEDEKCPVCGMFVAKYPKWAAKLHFKERSYSFDGVKDLMKFYFNPLKWGKYSKATKDKVIKFEVTDYYTQHAIDGFEAFYVIRSDIYGPMGNEFIPFKNEVDAKGFIRDHNGKKILKFKDITEKLPYELDTNGK